MNCEQADKLMMDSLMGALDDEKRQLLDEHLRGCARCRQEAGGFEILWQDLGNLETSDPPVPSARLTRRFRLALADYESEVREGRRPRLGEWWASLWTIRPAWQAAFSVVVLLLGIGLGALLARGQSRPGEIKALRAELEAMSRAVTVSLLEHRSASERLRAVSWSRMAGSDEQVLTALLEAVRYDPNVNVRLAAVDALAAHAQRGPVRDNLIDSLRVEDSPLVQLAVLEAVAGEKGLGNGELQKLIDSGEVDETVLQYFTEQAESL